MFKNWMSEIGKEFCKVSKILFLTWIIFEILRFEKNSTFEFVGTVNTGNINVPIVVSGSTYPEWIHASLR